MQTSIYESAVHGRREFREAFRKEREETKRLNAEIAVLKAEKLMLEADKERLIEAVADSRRKRLETRDENERLNAVCSERWHELKAAEKLVRQLTDALKGVLFVAKTEPGGVPYHLRRDIREAEKVLEIVASVKRERRRK